MKRILLGIGGTPFTMAAIDQAVNLAGSNNARLTAVTVVNADAICKLGPVPAGASIYARRLCENRLEVTRRQIEEAVEAFEKACEPRGIAHDVIWETGKPFDSMINHSRFHDLVIFGLSSLFEYQLVEQPEDEIIRLISHGVRPILAATRQFRPVRRVMVAFSGSMESAKAMRHFVQSRLWPQAALKIIHFSERADHGEALLKSAAAYCRDHGYSVDIAMIPGPAGDRLLGTAQEIDADLIVMGNSFRSIWLRKVLGDTVLRTLTRTDRPLYLSQ